MRLYKHYEIRDLGELKWFLGIRIIRDRLKRKIWLCQDSYIEKVAHTFHLTDGKAPPTPMLTDELLPYDGQATPGGTVSQPSRRTRLRTEISHKKGRLHR